MITTLPLKEIEKHADNIYEAIIILAKRARQINNQQKQTLFQEQEYEPYDDFEEEDDEVNGSEINYVKFPKPTNIALEEFLSGQIEFKYIKSENEDEEDV